MQRAKRKHVTSEEFRALFSRGRPVRIARIRDMLGVHPTTAWRLMRRHQVYGSVSHNAGFCVLPEMCCFDRLGFWEHRGMLFFRDGSQLDAIVRLVGESEAGMELAEIRAAMKVEVGMQLLGLVREGRLRREGKPKAYVYLAGDEQRAAQQMARRHAALLNAAQDKAEQTLAQLLAEESHENLQLLVNVLLTCLRHPEFTAKSVALSLLRRGYRTCTAQVRELLDRFQVSKKGGSWR